MYTSRIFAIADDNIGGCIVVIMQMENQNKRLRKKWNN